MRILNVANVSKEHIRKFHIPFINHMKQQVHTVDDACRMDEPVPECDNAYDLPCDRNPFKGGLIKSIRRLSEIIKYNDYDAVICNTLTGGIITRGTAAFMGKKMPKVFYIVHGLHFFEGASISRWIMGYPMEKVLAPFTDVLITINNADYKMVQKHLNPKEIKKIPGIGCNLDKFRSCQLNSEERNKLRESLGVSEKDLMLIYVAEINDNKNQGMLVKALQMIKADILEAKLVLVGPEHDGGQLRNTVNDTGLSDDVVFAGWRDDVPALLKAADIYVASSKSEGLPINLLEAMASNLPVVAGENRGHCEILDSGKNGYLVEKGDAEAMAELVVRIARDEKLRKELIEQAQSDIEKYASENVHQLLEEILEKYTYSEK